MCNIYTFVPHHFKRHYEKLGWDYHGQDDGFCACYVWRGEGRPILPTKENWEEANFYYSYDPDIWGDGDV